MLDTELLAEVARQMITSPKIEIGGKTIPVQRTSSQQLRTLVFELNGHEYQAIEQNPDKRSR